MKDVNSAEIKKKKAARPKNKPQVKKVMKVMKESAVQQTA